MTPVGSLYPSSLQWKGREEVVARHGSGTPEGVPPTHNGGKGKEDEDDPNGDVVKGNNVLGKLSKNKTTTKTGHIYSRGHPSY